MRDILKKLNVLLDKKQKRTMLFMVLMMIFGAVLEACSVSMVIPVVGVVIDENSIQKYEIVCRASHSLRCS